MNGHDYGRLKPGNWAFRDRVQRICRVCSAGWWTAIPGGGRTHWETSEGDRVRAHDFAVCINCAVTSWRIQLDRRRANRG